MESSPSLCILQLSDLHILPDSGQTLLGIDTEHYFLKILKHAFISNYQFDLILVTGDLAQDPCASSYQRIFDVLNSYPIPSICLPGNHDDYALMEKIFSHQKISCQRHTLLKDWQLICLNSQIINSENGELSLEELEFLDSTLNAYPDHFALIAVHHHCIESGSAWLDTMKIKNSTALFKLLSKHPHVKAITCGHVHQILDKTQENLRILATPSTCFQFKPGSEHFAVEQSAPGFRVIQLDKTGKIKTEVIRLPETLVQIELSNSGY